MLSQFMRNFNFLSWILILILDTSTASLLSLLFRNQHWTSIRFSSFIHHKIHSHIWWIVYLYIYLYLSYLHLHYIHTCLFWENVSIEWNSSNKKKTKIYVGKSKERKKGKIHLILMLYRTVNSINRNDFIK